MSVYLYWTYEAYYRSGYNSVVETRRIPLWPLVVVLATADLVVWVRWARSKRRSNTNCCEGCGYDRRGLAADATCPECGSAPAPKQPA